MKKFFKNIYNGLGIGVGILLVFVISIYVVKARSGLTSSTGDKLTSAKRNELVNKVESGGGQDYPQGALSAGQVSAEQDTGKKRIDGKEIYRRVVNLGAMGNGTNIDLTVTHGISSIDKIVNFYGAAIPSDPSTKNSRSLFGGASGAGTTIVAGRTLVMIKYSGSWTGRYPYVVMEYTKL